MVATIGENMSVRRTAVVTVGEGVVSEYVHNKVADGLGRIGVLVALESKGEKSALASLGRQLAMHIAAASPAAIRAEELDPALIERERAVYTEQARASGKSPEIAAKMVEGRLRKEFFQQVVLLQQIFLGAGGDGKATVDQVLKGAEKTAGAPVAIASFVRYALGEGDRGGADPAAEAAAGKGLSKPVPAQPLPARRGSAVARAFASRPAVGISLASDVGRLPAMSGSAHGFRYRRLLLKLSGEALMGKAELRHRRRRRDAPLPRDQGGQGCRRRDRRRHRRRQYLPRAWPARPPAWSGRRPTTWGCWPP